jgi:hypothetical protein
VRKVDMNRVNVANNERILWIERIEFDACRRSEVAKGLTLNWVIKWLIQENNVMKLLVNENGIFKDISAAQTDDKSHKTERLNSLQCEDDSNDNNFESNSNAYKYCDL